MTASVRVAADTGAALSGFVVPKPLGFGRIPAPVMFSADYKDGAWSDPRLETYGPISILPTARSIQFAESVFEGMKAYRARPAAPHFFRPDQNCARFALSASRIGMPTVPAELFYLGIHSVVSACADIIPEESGSSLYVRPFLFSTEPGFNVLSSKEFRFMVTASPSEAYTSGPMRVFIERGEVRAARHGIGAAKAGGNYAASLRSTTKAAGLGYSVCLWLDPLNNRDIEELSGMNVFAVVGDEVWTPPLSDSILAGVTRDSVIRLLRDRGIRVVEEPIAIDTLLQAIETGRCKEVFATGTAAIVTPITALGDETGTWDLTASEFTSSVREELLGIQERRIPDKHGWTRDLSSIIG